MLDKRRYPISGGVLVTLLIATALTTACGGTMTFADTSPVVVVGEPPAPPPPPPAPEPAKPKRVEVTADAIVITEKIQFDTNKATIKSESHGLLDELVGVFKDNARIRKVSIEGHTDSDGSDKYNLKLSDGRAQAVMAYLTEHGIDAARLTAKGFGETKPIGSNETAEGKEQNRRVEFLILEQDEVKKTYEIDPKTGKRQEVVVPNLGNLQNLKPKEEKAP